MNNKFFVSFEAARLLKEKGYDRECIAYYQNDEFHPYAFSRYDLSINDKNAAPPYMNQYSAPTKAEVIDWLESKRIIVELSYDDQAHMDNARWNYFIYTHDNDGWVEALVCSWYENDFYPTRLEAEEAAIIKACELL
jgi:hypothetical protein